MKIAQVVCVYPPYKGGIGSVASQYNDFAKGHGFDSSVLTPDYTREKEINKQGDVFKLRPFLKYGNGAFLPSLPVYLRKFDIVHLHYPFFGGAEMVWFAKNILRFKFSLIIHYHMDVLGLSFIGKILSLPSKLIINSLFKKADIVTCASFDYVERSQIASIFKKYKEKFYEMPFGVNEEKFKPFEALKNKEIKTELRILFVGGLDKPHYFKGVDILLKAVSIIKSDNWNLKIVGDGELKQKYMDTAKKLKIDNRVSFLDNVPGDEIAGVYRDSDVLVLPSINKNEAFGLVLLEAMSSGIPVIASDLPGVRKVFNDKNEGYLFEVGNYVDLADKIQYFFDKEKIIRMGRAGRQLVLSKYSLKEISQKLANLYIRVYGK